jgi:acetyl esterase/lipase
MTLLYQSKAFTANSTIDPPMPGSGGVGDVGTATNGKYDVGYNNIRFGTYAMATRTLETIRFVDNSLGGEPQWEIILGAEPNKTAPVVRNGPYSVKFYFRQTSTASTVTQPIMKFMNGATTQYSLVSVEQTRPAFSGLGGGVTAMSPATGMFRYELQVDPAASPKCTLNIYVEDSTTVHRTLTASPTDVSIDRLVIGHYISGNYSSSEVVYSNIEVYDTYNFDGNVNTPTTTPSYPTKYNYNPSTFKTDPQNTLVAGVDYTVHANLSYTTAGTFNRFLDLYIPTGTPPADGWPVVVWAHSGFFTNGSRTDLPPAWRDDLISAGYAVATVEYVLSNVTALAYDEYGGASNHGGRYPSHIVDFKRACAWLRDQTTYNIDGLRMFSTGYSAGGKIALDAASTRDLSTDTVGNPLSLLACTSASPTKPWSDGYTGPDPMFLGCLVYCAPVDMDLANAWDPTYPTSGSVIKLLAYRAFQGLTANGTPAPAMPQQNTALHIANNAANLCPIAYVKGASDYLVHWEHENALAAAMSTHAASIPAPAAGAKYTRIDSPNNHPKAADVYSVDDLLNWMNPLLSASYPYTGPTVSYYNGTTEVTGTLHYYDGTTEIPVTLEVS